MLTDSHKLDNPVWHSLNEVHQKFSVDYGTMKFYHPDFCPFGGFIDPGHTLKSIEGYSALTDNFYVVGDKPIFSERLALLKDLVCLQMVCEQPTRIEIIPEIVELQSNDHKKDLISLVNLVQPGYFKNKTSELGKYYGIYTDGTLVAVTGERMKMNGYSEVSAVVTHPGHTGKGYAKQLVGYAVNKIFDENKIPYLHVAETNTKAIGLYRKLNFETRRKISFWNLIVKK